MAKQKKAPVRKRNHGRRSASRRRADSATSAAGMMRIPGIGRNFRQLLAYLLLVTGLIATFFIRWQFIDLPFDRDEGTYIYAGQQILRGAIPYVDFYEIKPPSIFYSYALLIAIFGSTVKGIHLAFTAVVLLTQILLFLLLKRHINSFAAAFGSIVAGVISFVPSFYGFAALSEHLINLCLVLAFLLLQEGLDNKRSVWLAASGFAFAWMVLIKQTTVIFLPAYLFLFWILSREKSDKGYGHLLRRLGLIVGGGLLPAALFALVFLVQGNFEQFIFWNFKWPQIAYGSEMTWESGSKVLMINLGVMWYEIKYILALGCLGLILGYLHRSNRKMAIFLSIWFFCAFLFTVPGFRFYKHYFLVFLPIIASMCALGIATLTQVMSKTKFKRLSDVPGIAVMVIATLLLFNGPTSLFFKGTEEGIMRYSYGDNPFPEVRTIAQHLNTVIKPEDKLMVFGSEPEAYVYTKRASPTRHIFTNMIMKPTEYSTNFQNEVWKIYEELEPDFILWSQHKFSWGIKSDSDQRLYNRGYRVINNAYQLIALAEISEGPTKYYYNISNGRKPSTDHWVGLYRRR